MWGEREGGEVVCGREGVRRAEWRERGERMGVGEGGVYKLYY